MRSVGARLGFWVLGVPELAIIAAVVILYYYFGLSAVVQVIPWIVSGGAALVFLWQGLKMSAGKKLDFLNEYAFSPLRSLCGQSSPFRVFFAYDATRMGEVLEILKRNGRYLTFKLYPGKLLTLARNLKAQIEEYDPLWMLLYGEANKRVVQDPQMASTFGGTADMGAILFQLGFREGVNEAYYSQEKKDTSAKILEWFRQQHGKELARLVLLHKTVNEGAKSLANLLDEFMRANLLRRLGGTV